MSDVVQKLWGFCHTLRHDGIDYGDYIEQMTYPLSIRMADERGIRLEADRWRKFSIDEVKARDFKLDGFKWLRDDSLEDADDLPEPEELVTDAIGELEEAVSELSSVLTLLDNETTVGDRHG